jgi:hypothetical protein
MPATLPPNTSDNCVPRGTKILTAGRRSVRPLVRSTSGPLPVAWLLGSKQERIIPRHSCGTADRPAEQWISRLRPPPRPAPRRRAPPTARATARALAEETRNPVRAVSGRRGASAPLTGAALRRPIALALALARPRQRCHRRAPPPGKANAFPAAASSSGGGRTIFVKNLHPKVGRTVGGKMAERRRSGIRADEPAPGRGGVRHHRRHHRSSDACKRMSVVCYELALGVAALAGWALVPLCSTRAVFCRSRMTSLGVRAAVVSGPRHFQEREGCRQGRRGHG